MNRVDEVQKIINVVKNYYGLTDKELFSKSRKSEITRVRHLIVYFLRYELGITFREIGNILNKDTSTIIRNFQTVSNLIRHDQTFKFDYEYIKQNLL